MTGGCTPTSLSAAPACSLPQADFGSTVWDTCCTCCSSFCRLMQPRPRPSMIGAAWSAGRVALDLQQHAAWVATAAPAAAAAGKGIYHTRADHGGFAGGNSAGSNACSPDPRSGGGAGSHHLSSTSGIGLRINLSARCPLLAAFSLHVTVRLLVYTTMTTKERQTAPSCCSGISLLWQAACTACRGQVVFVSAAPCLRCCGCRPPKFSPTGRCGMLRVTPGAFYPPQHLLWLSSRRSPDVP